jgi:FtsZ-interacting cell division protein ZipA
MDAGEIAVFIPIVALFIPIVAVWTKHKERMEQIRLQQGTTNTVAVDESLRTEVMALKEQLMALRDTTTKFDLSFDSALDGVEARLKRVEERQLTQGYQTSDDAQKLTLGR